MRECSNNPIEHFAVSAVKLALQPAEKSDLVRVQRTAVKMKPVRNSDTAMTALYRFNRIGASQNDEVPVNGSPPDVKLMCQIASSLTPPEDFGGTLPPAA